MNSTEQLRGQEAEDPSPEIPLSHRSTSQSGMRAHNERLILSLVRAHGALPKAEIARLAGLSAQAVSVIVRQMETDRLVRKGASIKGRIGQPSQPYSLNPEGAFSLGLKVGRRSGDLLLIGLDGLVRQRVHMPYHFPTPAEFLTFASAGLKQILTELGDKASARICGIGVAEPFDLWKWQEETGAPHEKMAAWKDFNLTAELARLCPWPVIDCNDATAACAAELFFGNGRSYGDHAYLYVGYFIGGGLVLNGQLHQGPNGNAAAIGSMPVPRGDGGTEQLIRSASLFRLELALRNGGIDPALLWQQYEDWSAAEPHLEKWIATAARGISLACAGIASIIECKAVIIDGAMPGSVRQRLTAAVIRELAQVNLDGITPFDVRPGSIGPDARALGAASLPLFANFMIDRDVLFKELN